MAMVVSLSVDEKASRALMATEVAPVDAQVNSASGDSPQKLLENAVESVAGAVGSPASRAKEGDNALNTLVEVAAGERPDGPAELLPVNQEPSSSATKEEGEKMLVCESCAGCVCVGSGLRNGGEVQRSCTANLCGLGVSVFIASKQFQQQHSCWLVSSAETAWACID